MLNEAGLSWLLDRVNTEANVHVLPTTLVGVEVIRRSDNVHTWLFALNHADQPAEIALDRPGRDLITGVVVDKSIRLGPTGVAIIQSPAT